MPQHSSSKTQPFKRGPWHDRFFKSHFETPRQIRSLLALALTAAQLKLFDLDSVAVRKSGLPDADTFASWLVQCGSLPKRARRETIRSLHKYFAQTHQAVTMLQMKRALQMKRSGDEAMQDRQLIDEIIREWNGVLPESYGEAHSQGIEKGRKEGIKKGKQEGIKKGKEEGIEEGFREATCEFARRMIQDGMLDSDIQRYTQLSMEEIGKLRNGSRID